MTFDEFYKSKLFFAIAISIIWLFIFSIYSNVFTTRVSTSDISYMSDQHKGTINNVFIYKGEILLPQSVIEDITDKPIEWVGREKTLYIGERISSKCMSDILEPFYSNSDIFKGYSINSNMTIASKEYSKGYQMDMASMVSFNLDGKYESIEGLLGLDDRDNDADTVVHIYNDDNLIESFNLKAGELPLKFNLNVDGVLKLDIQTQSKDAFNQSTIDLVDIQIK